MIPRLPALVVTNTDGAKPHEPLLSSGPNATAD